MKMKTISYTQAFQYHFINNHHRQLAWNHMTIHVHWAWSGCIYKKQSIYFAVACLVPEKYNSILLLCLEYTYHVWYLRASIFFLSRAQTHLRCCASRNWVDTHLTNFPSVLLSAHARRAAWWLEVPVILRSIYAFVCFLMYCAEQNKHR